MIAGTGWHVRQIDTFAIDVVLPSVRNAADPALLVAPEEKIGAAMRAVRLDQPDSAFRVTEGDQIFPYHPHTNGRAIGFGQVPR